MLYSCPRCGRVHPYGQCPVKNQIDGLMSHGKKEPSQNDKFRRGRSWQRKRQRILERDLFLCKVCLDHKYNYSKVKDNRHLQVHHIIPLSERFDLKLNSNNLISLCSYHHKLAELGEIPRSYLQALAKVPPIKLFNQLTRKP